MVAVISRSPGSRILTVLMVGLLASMSSLALVSSVGFDAYACGWGELGEAVAIGTVGGAIGGAILGPGALPGAGAGALAGAAGEGIHCLFQLVGWV